MGIRNLSDFIQDAFTADWVVKDLQVCTQGDHGRKPINLVIDGLSLCHHLYEELTEGRCQDDLLFGGDSVSFAKYIRDFFTTLMKHNIKAFVIFDGADIELKKSKTQDKRRKQDTETVQKLLAGRIGKDKKASHKTLFNC